ncbi:MAG: MarR family transcriptional regulator [Actinobacteria bacterium]|nr:MarR family transcriptional regulator [Actinomycetota bacterium]
MSGPATAVKTAIAGRATTVDAISRATGLPSELVTAITGELERAGELEVDHIGFGCPADACGSCSSSASCPSPVTE